MDTEEVVFSLQGSVCSEKLKTEHRILTTKKDVLNFNKK